MDASRPASVTASVTALAWTEWDQRAVDTARILAADAVQKVGNGHPGTAMSLAPAAYTLFQKVMRHDPADPDWVGRDRFVLSAGHSSLTLYIQLYLGGFGLELADLESFRTFGSKTPGHPEYGHTRGVETTTGPLGQGVANAVGMAMAARYERGLFDPEAAVGESPFDHHVFAIAGDGCLQEGISAEASSLAGHQKLGNLVLLWDDNHISIEGDTETAVSEDVTKRYEAYGWHVQRVEPKDNGDLDPVALFAAIEAAKAVTDRPSFIAMRSIIAWPAPHAQNTEAAHGSALGADEVAATKQVLGFDPEKSFDVADEVIAHTRALGERGREARAVWDKQLQEWRDGNAGRASEFDRISAGELPEGWESHLPEFETGKGVATRAASGKVLQALGAVIPELWGGSADLAGSNNTTIDKTSSFLPADNPLPEADPYGRTVHFGIREHSMAAEMNGIALHGNTRIYGGTFLVFSDYMRNAVRLSALMHLPVTYVWTHDSIGLGEDGPTHQPVEHLASLRAIPGLNVVRPADANETAIAWREILRRWTKEFGKGAPHGLALTRQGVPTYEADEDAAKGGYVLFDASNGAPEVVLIATGSEVHVAVEARERLEADGVPTRVVSMPCVEWFEEQDQGYRESVLPPSVKARVAVEAGIGLTWHKYVGDAGRIVSLEHFGASADGKVLFQEFGFTAENVAAAARESLGSETPSGTSCTTDDPLERLSGAGVSIWLDDLSRGRITSGSLAELVRRRRVVGVTTNPTIFQQAVGDASGYAEQIYDMALRGVTVSEAVRMITAADVRDAADILRPVFDTTQGRDGWVSIEVEPRLAHGTDATAAEARHLSWLVDRPNTLIKIPATRAGLRAITEVIGLGISVNVTLIFSLERYRQVMDAYLAGLEKARERGLDLSKIHSVASFFVSRVDTEIDKRLEALGTPEAAALRGKAGIANARLAYQAYEEVFGSADGSTPSSQRWAVLHRLHANKQRPLWASTGVKDPAYPDTRYVTELVAPGIVNTMPEATLEATADHGEINGNSIAGTYEQARAHLDALEKQGISYVGVVQALETEGIQKFQQSWDSLLEAVRAARPLQH
ncbi:MULTISPECIES: transketolase [Streptomyces]|uniref:transketolase n=1 Tax=Streptomyces TaxID=1883 RepID=UPI000BE3DECD|nr:transketolase [Streptomyces sp. 1222.2]